MRLHQFIAGVLVVTSLYAYAPAQDEVSTEEKREEGVAKDEREEAAREEAGTPEKAEQSVPLKSTNIDMQLVYGLYNNMLSSISLSREQRNSAFLLNSNFTRSNDFGYNRRVYENTGFYNMKIGGTASVNTTETGKLLSEIEVNNDSRGMYKNPVYSREDKDEAKLRARYLSKLTSEFEGYVLLGGALYKHRLHAVLPIDRESSSLGHGVAEMGGEYIFSGSNRIRGKINGGYYVYYHNARAINEHRFRTDDPVQNACLYTYLGSAPDDLYMSAEIIDDFNLTKNFGVSLGIGFDMNRDDMKWRYPAPIAGLTLKGLKYLSAALQYRFDLRPFAPEEFYLQQKYIMPAYDLPPGRVHRGEGRLELKLNETLNVRCGLLVERNNRFYNYRPVYGDVLSAETLAVTRYSPRLDAVLSLYKSLLEITIGYEYNRFDASQRITYTPQHEATGSVKYNGRTWKIEWANRYAYKIFTDPDDGNTLSPTLLGSFGIQRQMLEGFYAYFRIENLYNTRYTLREAYPEPGVTFLGGLRILI